MRILPLHAELAVMNALRALNAKPDQTVDFRLLTEIWPEYGLRCGDLQDAVARLAGQDLLRLVEDPQPNRLALTEAGKQWADAQPGLREYLLLYPRRSQYQESLLRDGRPAAVPAIRRRQADSKRETRLNRVGFSAGRRR